MSHYNRRLYHQPQSNKRGESFERASPFRNNELRLKQIYEAGQVFKQKNKEPTRKIINRPQPPLTTRKNNQGNDIRLRSYLHNLNLVHQARQTDRTAERITNPTASLRYQPGEMAAGTENERKGRSNNREGRGREEGEELFKIRSRKSISGSLKKKVREQVGHSSVNPTVVVDLNYQEEGRRLYKEGRIAQALRLFELAIDKGGVWESYYYAGLCCLSKHNYQKALQYLTNLLQKYSDFAKRAVYLFAAIAAKNLGQPNKGIELCSAGLQRFHDYLDLLIYRAKLFDLINDWESAHKDYETVLLAKKDHVQALFSNALCLKKLGLINNCMGYLNSAFYADQKGEFKARILLERLKINHETGNIKQCKKDLTRLLELEGDQSQAYYYKGLVLLKEGNKKDAILAFEKSIRLGGHKQSTAGSLVEITKTKIEDRDFYSAYYHINRGDFLQVSTEQMQKFRLFTQGVIYMMKRKINQGIQNLYQLELKYPEMGPYFQKLYYLYRAFGHFMQNKHELAIKDYQMAEKFSPKDKYIKYNQLVAEGVVQVSQAHFNEALQKFDNAQAIISAGGIQKIEPFIYRGMTFIQKIKDQQKGSNKMDQLQTLEEIFVGLKELDKAYDVNDGNSNMLFLRSLIYMYLGKYQEGLQDIIKAISKSQQNVAKYFFYRGLAHETLANKKQALNDFNICINLDQNYYQAYLERAKLLFSNNQASKGLEDLNKVKELKPEIDSKYNQCCLLYLIKEYDLAESCLEGIEQKDKQEEMKVLICLKQLRVTEAKGLMRSAGDRMICDIILGKWEVEEVPHSDLCYFSRSEYYNYLGIKCYHQNKFEEAISNFTLGIKQKNLSDLQQNMGNCSDEDGEQELEGVIDMETHSNQLHYLNYNLFVTYLKNGEKKKAYEIFIRDILPAKQHFLKNDSVGKLSRLLFHSMKGNQGDKQNQIQKQKERFELLLFRSIIGEGVDFIQLQMPGFILVTKLCYPCPFAKQLYRQFSARINPNFILNCLDMKQVQNRPEPPWVKRNNQDLIFTDEVIDINVQFQTTEHDEQQEEALEGEEEGEQQQQEQEQEQNQQEQAAQVFDPRKFRDQMRLDEQIEKKLQRIMGRKKQ